MQSLPRGPWDTREHNVARALVPALVPVPMGTRRPTELHENPCAIDVAQALRPAASRLFGTLLAASRAGAREGVFEAAA
ncbi:MAG TPA: hypothetical protein VMH81_37100, partial [Bryobacteraceae bacterium]|nr:hypothetical protein [Bryobacteraceae bacterium]